MKTISVGFKEQVGSVDNKVIYAGQADRHTCVQEGCKQTYKETYNKIWLVSYFRLSNMYTAASSGFVKKKKKKTASRCCLGHVFHSS